MKDGTVYVLSEWKNQPIDSVITGYGSYLDINRRTINSIKLQNRNGYQIPYSKIALLETNDPGTSNVAGLALITVFTTGISIYCAINPKACFGSCPTFYAKNKRGESELMAEGFSSSILPSLEDEDYDMLINAAVYDGQLDITITNEAQETHMIKKAQLYAFPKDSNEQIFRDNNNKFWSVSKSYLPHEADRDKDFLTKISKVDQLEYYSAGDANNIASKEEIILEFQQLPGKKLGLVLGKRQSLMTTYLFYQSLSYMGRSVTHWLAWMENNEAVLFDIKSKNIFNILGGIEVLYYKGGDWVRVDEVRETGPIAKDYLIVPLPEGELYDKIKLRMTKGLWRLDYIALAEIDREAIPIIIEPQYLEKNGISELLELEKLINEDDYLISLPGDSIVIRYNLAEGIEYELFLRSKGYYLEWIRDAWMKDQKLSKLKLMIKKPEKFIRKETEGYKKSELSMEKIFWNSRYVKK